MDELNVVVELAPGAMHPARGRTFAALLSELSDTSLVARRTPAGGREGLSVK